MYCSDKCVIDITLRPIPRNEVGCAGKLTTERNRFCLAFCHFGLLSIPLGCIMCLYYCTARITKQHINAKARTVKLTGDIMYSMHIEPDSIYHTLDRIGK